jgi:hypothetical protein
VKDPQLGYFEQSDMFGLRLKMTAGGVAGI